MLQTRILEILKEISSIGVQEKEMPATGVDGVTPYDLRRQFDRLEKELLDALHPATTGSPKGAGPSIRSVASMLLEDAFCHQPDQVITLFPFFAKLCGDRKEGSTIGGELHTTTDVDWQVLTGKPAPTTSGARIILNAV